MPAPRPQLRRAPCPTGPRRFAARGGVSRRRSARSRAPTPRGESATDAFEQQLEQAKLDALKELAYGASHEINNPLANIALRAQTLLKREDDPAKRKALQAMHRAAMRAHEMISDLMLYARPPRRRPKRVDLCEASERAIEELRGIADDRRIELNFASDERPVFAWVDEEQAGVVMRALLDNSLEAIGESGSVLVTARAVDEGAEVCVSDDGPGLPEHVRAHAFDPFYSGREAGRGLGFGLSKCWRIVTDHGGSITIECPPDGGARVVVRLPAA